MTIVAHPNQNKISLPIKKMPSDEDLRRCVVDLLMYADCSLRSVGQAFGLPRLSLGVASKENVLSFYGIRLKDLILRIRDKDFAHFETLISEGSVEELIHAFVSSEKPEVSARYAGLLRQLRAALSANQLTATLRFESIADALTGAFEGLVQQLPKKEAAEAKVAGKPPKAAKLAKVSRKTVPRDLLADLQRRAGLAKAVDEIAQVLVAYMSDRDGRRQDWSSGKVTTVAARSYLSAAKRSLSRFATGLTAADKPTRALGVHVTDKIVADDSVFTLLVKDGRIELRRGAAVKVDLTVTLPKIVMTVALFLKRFSENVNDVKTAVLQLLDACIEVFETADSEESRAVRAKVLHRFQTSPDKTFAFKAAHSKALTNLGLLAGGGPEGGVPAAGDQHVMQYPQQQQQQQPQQPQMVHVQEHADPYIKTCFGCFVALEALETCMHCCEFCS
jgi:hypothetical protein